MKVVEIIDEAYALGNMPDISDEEYQTKYSELLTNATKLANVRNNIELYMYGHNYLLVKNKSIVLGNVSLRPVNINGAEYLNVDGIYIPPKFRKSSAAHWLLYAVKEHVTIPVVADGAIFAGGQDLIQSILKHKVFNVSAINTSTGEISDLTGPINSPNYAYLFSNAKLGFGKQMFEEGLPFTWYPLFEEIE